MRLFQFMASSNGRVLRIVVGLALVMIGLFGLGGGGGWALAVVGFVPMAAGLFDVCLFAPLFGAPFRGQDIRDTPIRWSNR